MKKEISIIIMLSAFSVSAMAGGEVRLGKSETYDNEYELMVEHEVNEEVSQLNQDEYAVHPIRNDSGVMQYIQYATIAASCSQEKLLQADKPFPNTENLICRLSA